MQLATVLSERDKSLIHKLYIKSPVHKRSLAEMATLERVRGTTDINRFRIRMVHLGFQCTLPDVAEVFKDLEKAGFGKLLIGSYVASKPYRFKWSKSNIVQVGKEATKNDKTPSKAEAQLKFKTNDHGGTVATTKSGRMLCMYQTPSGERLRLVFNTVAEVQELIELLQEIIKA